MIERIYIPTLKRAKRQLTYDNLPAELQKRVVMVIRSEERGEYDYPCHYLEVPENFVGAWTELSMTRKFIHEHAIADGIKYVMADDDAILFKRNQKYFGGLSDMEKSKRVATEIEVLQLFETASDWLDEKHLGIVGLSDGMTPPPPAEYSNSKGVYNFIFCDGKKIGTVIDQYDTSTRVAEDVMFLFTCLTNGINTRQSNTFRYSNQSLNKDYKDIRPVWEGLFTDQMPENYFQTLEHYNSLQKVKEKFPAFITIYEKDGVVKNTKHWKKAYEYGRTNTDVTETQHYLESIRNG
jgi:hypothetical protein